MANHYCGAFTFLVLYTTSSMRSGSSLCPFFSVRRRSADPSRSVLPSSSPSVLLLSASHRCSPGRRSDLLRLRSVLGGSVVLAVVGLGLRAAALAVAVAARAAPALIACLSEAVLPRGATVGFESHGFFCSGAACSFCLGPSFLLLVGLVVLRVVAFSSASMFQAGHRPSAIALLALASLSFSSIFSSVRSFDF